MRKTIGYSRAWFCSFFDIYNNSNHFSVQPANFMMAYWKIWHEPTDFDTIQNETKLNATRPHTIDNQATTTD